MAENKIKRKASRMLGGYFFGFWGVKNLVYD
jgi:hypothetical protein